MSQDMLEGKTFVITGDFYYYSSRELLRRIIETHGGKVTGSVSSKTTALITNCPDSGTTKIKKAKELGVEIINEEEFDNRYLFKKGDYANKTKMLYPDFNIVYGAITRYSGPDGAVVIPDGVTAIGDEAFAGTNITSVVIPESVTTIGFRAFSSCKRLTSITISEHTERIGYGAFAKCENLTIHAPYGSSAERYAMEHNILFDGFGTKKLIPIDPALKFDDSMEAVNAVFRGPDQDVAAAVKDLYGVAVRRVAPDVSEFILNGTATILLVLENYPNLKTAMFVELFNRSEVHMAYSRSGYPHITDTYFVGYCDFHDELRWDWKHLPTEKQFHASSLFSNTGERASVSYSFRMEHDWNAINYYAISADNAPRQTQKTDKDSLTKHVMEQVEVKNGRNLSVDELKGKAFVVTGDLYHYENRDALKKIIEDRGGKLTGSVSSKTTALITNFPDSGTTKIKKAQDLGIEIITEDEFIRRYLSK